MSAVYSVSNDLFSVWVQLTFRNVCQFCRIL